MTFLYPALLFGLVVPAGLLIWVWANRWTEPGSRIVLPFDHGRPGSGWLWWVLLGLAESLPALLLAAGILLLAGPQKYGAPETRRRMTNIQFCVDVSGSMTAPFGDATRYDAAMKSIDKFLDFRKG